MPFSLLDQKHTPKNTTGRKAFAVLLDPDNLDEKGCLDLIQRCNTHAVDYILVGGSLVTQTNQTALIRLIKKNTAIPVILFPSSTLHIDVQADGILFLSLISGRNPEFLIGQHVIAAPLLKASKLKVIPTGYMLVDSGRQTTASYMSGTTPLPYDKPAIAASTALAGELLGLQVIYLDAGSGAQYPITPEMIAAVRQSINIPLIVGGGINNVQKAAAALAAGADIIVVGNHIENDPIFIGKIAQLVREYNNEIAL
ncbi:geranylgeranylglyceryl phosphate synthase [Adhaeribacter aerolatus]|uniref:Geranylgeranylglyceryl phosphate synthase n=1 Tax=Adhaeribacter aerolatus TaxID=670289 RepID=A0A512AV66_9BACT|nr:geranylgeranylglyceryl/heptaprenylglyceryl phosphate synthase [Adhaeribacter aerolatus]GEO03427.1 geranylgeranylglyceryl phosphate synthase [Adhaeribacter aerolatus]